MKITAVIPSAGKGQRIKSREAKPYIKISGKPILARTLEVLQRSRCIDEIIVASDERKKPNVRAIVKKYKLTKVKNIITGGATRFISVSNCLKHLDDDTDYVIVHDGVRPFITEDLIKRTLRAAQKVGASVAGVPLIPTIKKIDQRFRVISTPPRHQFWIAQTPQVFKKDIIVKAYKLAKRKRIKPTDDSMLVELSGRQVAMVEGSYRNIKITTPEDLRLAKVLWREKS